MSKIEVQLGVLTARDPAALFHKEREVSCPYLRLRAISTYLFGILGNSDSTSALG